MTIPCYQKSAILLLALLLGGCGTLPVGNNDPVTVKSLQAWYERERRVKEIGRHIFVSNLQSCPEKRKYYGFEAMSLSHTPEGKLRAEAFHIKDALTVTMIIPDSPAARDGLRVGDAITSVNGVQWSRSDPKQAEFGKEIYSALRGSSMRLVIRRGEHEKLDMVTAAEEACDATVVLARSQGTMGYAQNRNVFIESGLEELLSNDAELAFVIAHEAAHIILGHTNADKKKDLGSRNTRFPMEQAADDLGMQLMIQAGYEPEAATTAVKKMDYANRGPISRWLGLYGSYMPTEQRVNFLRISAKKVTE